MKVILYMAATINGFIAAETDDTSWISKEEWNSYSAIVRKTGNVIMGRRTYEIITTQPEFSEFQDVQVIVVSSQTFQTKSSLHSIVHSPKEALDMLQDYKEVIVAGGSGLNAAFLRDRLVDEMYIDIEPVLLGKGIPLFQAQDFQYSLKLLGTTPIGLNGMQLHYQLLKGEDEKN